MGRGVRLTPLVNPGNTGRKPLSTSVLRQTGRDIIASYAGPHRTEDPSVATRANCACRNNRQDSLWAPAPQGHTHQGRDTAAAVPRISRLMALAIRMQELVDTGEVADYAELARLAHVSRPRITQIMNLTLLAPDVQEAILFLPAKEGGHGPVGERAVRRISAVAGWRKQSRIWRRTARSVQG